MSMRPRLLLALGVGLVLGLGISLAGKVMAERPAAAGAAPAADTPQAMSWEDARLLAEVLQRVRENYVEPVDDRRLMRAATHGLVESLDEYSGFLERDEYDELKVATSGSYAGVGIEIEADAGNVHVLRSMAGSPAEKAGLKAGDQILRIDGKAVLPGQLDAAVEQMRGAANTSVQLAVQRGTQELSFTLQRTQVELSSVDAQMLAPGYGYLRLTSFTDSSGTEFVQALGRLTEAAAPARIKGLVLDLRNNPGGVFDAAVEIADDLLEKGVIVSARGRSEAAQFVEEARPGDVSGGAELIVLVNGASASAAEILAAALRENQRALLYGRRTYGKGSVQTVLPLSGGQALKLTTSIYYTPQGNSLNHLGLKPDVEIGGVEPPPAELDPPGRTPTLASRDVAVGIALQALRSHSPVAAVPARPQPRS